MEQSSKWPKEQIMALIEAYKEEPCLNAVKSQNYHNKNLRAAALQRIVNAVRVVREIATEKEWQQKIHNLRSQFNIENAKRKSSLKSGIGTNGAYIPSLWYYEHLMFLEEHFVPRKSKASPIRIISKNPIYQNIQLNSHDFNSQVTCEVNESLNESSLLYVIVQDKESDTENISLSTTLLTPSSTPLPLSTSTSISTLLPPLSSPTNSSGPSLIEKTAGSLRSVQACNSALVCSPAPSYSPAPSCSSASAYSPAPSCSSAPAYSPAPSCIPAPSCSSTLSPFSVFSSCQPPISQESRAQKKRKKQSDDFQCYVGAIESIAESLRQPTPLSASPAIETRLLDSVDSCVQFLGSMLKEIDCEKTKLEVISIIVQTVINAKTNYVWRTLKDT